MTFFGHSVCTKCCIWSEIGQVLVYLLGLITLVIVYDQNVLGKSLAVAIYENL